METGYSVEEDMLRAFSINDVLERVPIGRTALYEQIKLGRLRIKKVGNRTLITAKALRDWLYGAETSEAQGV